MIPYRTTGDDPEPIFPWVNIGLIVTCFLVFFYVLALGSESGNILNSKRA